MRLGVFVRSGRPRLFWSSRTVQTDSQEHKSHRLGSDVVRDSRREDKQAPRRQGVIFAFDLQRQISVEDLNDDRARRLVLRQSPAFFKPEQRYRRFLVLVKSNLPVSELTFVVLRAKLPGSRRQVKLEGIGSESLTGRSPLGLRFIGFRGAGVIIHSCRHSLLLRQCAT